MALQLTSLPGEIRNAIYKIVLSSPEPLIIWVDPAGARRICRQQSRGLSSLTYLFSSYTGGSKIEFNQLKYVSRMFYAETHGLECRYNAIVVQRRRRLSAAATS
jgi:hypothetical protein